MIALKIRIYFLPFFNHIKLKMPIVFEIFLECLWKTQILLYFKKILKNTKSKVFFPKNLAVVLNFYFHFLFIGIVGRYYVVQNTSYVFEFLKMMDDVWRKWWIAMQDPQDIFIYKRNRNNCLRFPFMHFF